MVFQFRAFVASFALLAPIAIAEATQVTFSNRCSNNIELYDNSRTESLSPSGSTVRQLANGFHGMFRHGNAPEATLVEFSITGGSAWYDISAIPPGPGNCKSFADCAAVTGKKGYNVPVSISPDTTGVNAPAVCRTLICESEQCPDAYLYPSDDLKTHNCPDSVPFTVTFCPSGNAVSTPTAAESTSTTLTTGDFSTSTTPPSTDATWTTPVSDVSASTPWPSDVSASTPWPADESTSSPWATDTFPSESIANDFQSGVVTAATTVSSIGAETSTTSEKNSTWTLKSSFSYKNEKAGNIAGTYQMVTNTNSGCVKEPVTVHSPVGPLSEEVSLVFRGPMEIFNIAVFDGSEGGDWKKVSSYAQGSEAINMLFMNNKNIDYTTGFKSPQGFASSDGLTSVSSPSAFSGTLAEASNGGKLGDGPGVATGAEVNIMTSTKCSASSPCKGYSDDNGFHGWDGGKKAFVTKVRMPTGSTPNQPALWMLNAQILRSNQYGCNCRGMGSAGGCGELDIAEVIETNAARDKVTTHYYFYDGNIAAGGDNFAARPTKTATIYITIIDESGEGTIKVLEIGEREFDFSMDRIGQSQIAAWIAAEDKNLLYP